MIAQRILNLQESKTLKAAAQARALKEAGVDVVDLTLGEPDFNTPEVIIKAMEEAVEDGKGHHYAPAAGEMALRKAIAKYYEAYHQVSYEASNVFTANGVKMILYYLCQVLLNPLDEVLIPTPYWVSYYEQVRLAGGVPIIVDTKAEEAFNLTVEALKEKVTAKTKLLMLNSPSNPSGAILKASELEKIGQFCVENDIMILSDEIYNRLTYHGENAVSIASLSPEIRAKTITINGVSKAFAMTGWRLGYCMGPSEVIKGLTKLASQGSGSPSGPAQYASIAALELADQEVEAMRKAFEQRLDHGYERMLQIPGFCLDYKPSGAFYLFPNCTEAAKILGLDSVDALAEKILNEAHVSCVAGSAFGLPDHIRFSYATDEERFALGMDRIEQLFHA